MMPQLEYILLSRKWRAYCIKEKKYIAPSRDNEEEAMQDSINHAAEFGHETTYHVTTKRMAVPKSEIPPLTS